jgi:alkanesulfonate monooxygenase SsuD/methylene tetrahydromethanopterin reductase-like flavin-dependent oxidoreductase (luciferase family)
MRALWADAGPSGANFDGEFVTFHNAHSFPKPVQPGGVPLHIGGHSQAAARRAGRLGDGFQPLGLEGDQLGVRLTEARQAAVDAGRDPEALEVSLSGYLPTLSEKDIVEAHEAGASRLVISASMSAELDRTLDEMSAFGERFIVSEPASGAPASDR